MTQPHTDSGVRANSGRPKRTYDLAAQLDLHNDAVAMPPAKLNRKLSKRLPLKAEA
jgi:hypothetical protein